MASAVWSRPRKANRAVFERPQKPTYRAAGNLHAPLALRSRKIFVTGDDEEESDGNYGLAASRSVPHFDFTLEATPLLRKKIALAAGKSSTALFLSSPAPSARDLSPASTSDLLLQGASVENLGDDIPTGPVMGKNWKQMQEATFTNWINERLKVKQSNYTGPRIQDTRTDLCDGLALIGLLEVLTNKKITGYVKQPRVTAHKMVNLDLALKFIADEGVKLIGIGSHNIFEGNLGLIMGLVWTLIQKYQIRIRSTRVSTKAVMIHWLQSILPGWKISNLNTDWNDGRCLMALIGEVKPGVGHDVRMLDPTKRRQNCARALAIAANHLKIPQLIAPDDLSNPHIDDLSVMTYLSYFCEPAKQRLLKWVKQMIPHMRITNFGGDWADGRAFGALIDACFPGLFPGWQQMEPGKTQENMALILPLVKRSLGIEVDFTAAELARGQVEELKVMTFINSVRHGKLLSLPSEVVVAGPGLEKAVVGKETHFEIDTTQAGPGKLFIDAYYKNGLKVTFTIRERLPGVITLTYTPEICGVVNFDILWSDSPIPKSPFSVPVSDSQLIRIVDFEHHPRTVQVNQSLELLLNTRPAGGSGRLFAKLEYEQKGVCSTEAHLTRYPDSTVKLSYRPSVAGKAVLRIFWNDEELPHLAVTYVVIDNMQYRIIAKPEEKVYRTFQHANFQVKSDNGQLNALTMTANSEDIQLPITFSSIQGNIGHASFVPTFPGSYRIEVSCVEKLIEGTPFTIEVADPSQCKLVGTLPTYLKLNSPYEFRVHTGNAGRGILEVTCPDRSVSCLFDTSVRKLASGDSQGVVVTPRQMGNYLLGITFFGGHIPSSPFQVTVVDPSQCSVSGEVFNRGRAVVGKPVRFQIIRTGPGKDVKPQVKASGPSAKYVAEVSTSDDRIYFVRFTPWEIGSHEISITYGGFDIPRSPFRMGLQGFDSDICSATGSGLQQALSGIPAQFFILAKQTGLIEDGVLAVSICNVTQTVDCRVRIRDNKNGTYQVAYLVHLPGAYLINILAAGAHIPGSPFRLTAKPGPEAIKCSMWGPALEPNALLTIGKPIDFKVSTHGAGTGTLSVKAVGPGGTQARVYLARPEDRTGNYDVKLDPIRHGKYRLSVKWSGQHIPGSPQVLKIFQGADPSKCRAYGPGLEDGIVGRPSTFMIETRDAGAGTLKVRLHGVKNAFKIEVRPKDQFDQRTLQARYDPRKPGEYLITIKWEDKNIPGSPFKVKIEGDYCDDSEDDAPKATPISPGLAPIIEESDEEMMTSSEPNIKTKKKRRGRKKKPVPGMMPMMPVLVMNPYVNLEPGQMPMFQPGKSGQVPYQVAFMQPPPPHTRGTKRTKRKAKNSKGHTVSFNSQVSLSPDSSTTDLHSSSGGMLTFSSLRVKKTKPPVADNVMTSKGESFTGHASMSVATVTKSSRTVKGIIKKSESSAGRKF